MIGPQPTLKKGRFYELPDGNVIEVLRVTPQSAKVRSVASRKTIEICSMAEIPEVPKPTATPRKRGKEMAQTKTKIEERSYIYDKYAPCAVLRFIGENIEGEKPMLADAAVSVFEELGVTINRSTAAIQIGAGLKRGKLPEMTKTEQKRLTTKLTAAYKKVVDAKKIHQVAAEKARAESKEQSAVSEAKSKARSKTAAKKPITKADQVGKTPSGRKSKKPAAKKATQK